MNEKIKALGIDSKKAQLLLKEYGFNELSFKNQRTTLTIFLSQFSNFLTLLLIAAASVSFIAKDIVDGSFILLVVLLNTLFGFYQEFKAEESLHELKKMTVTTVRVVRDGQEKEIDSRFIVPEDIVYIEEGTKITADGVLVESSNLEIDESSLTGESIAVLKDVDNEKHKHVFMGTHVIKGRGFFLVEKTGDNTNFGSIAKTLSTITDTKTPLQKKLIRFSKQLGILGIIAAISVFIITLYKGETLLKSFLFAVSLAVAAVPEGLPAVMTVALAAGVKRMAKKKAIVRRLESIETLGSVTLIATDKTGTLTQNSMQVKYIYVEGKALEFSNNTKNDTLRKLLINACVCSTASLVAKVDHGEQFDILGDPTEGALLLAADTIGINYNQIRGYYHRIKEVPFDAKTKIMTVVASDKKEKVTFSKGAPETILESCSYQLMHDKKVKLTTQDKKDIDKEWKKLAALGFRLIAFSEDNVFLGFVALHDPLRLEAKEAVFKAKRAGMTVVMITGDNSLTAQAVGIEVGIITEGEDIIEGFQIDEYSDAKLKELLPKTKIFARTTPLHKYRLVKLFQELGEIVAVTGDGVNDALALKQAEVGVAMGIAGTDVAKETADVILTDDNFATLVGAIEEGRTIFTNIKKAIIYLVSTNLAETIVVITTLLTVASPVLTALQILYINLVSDGLPALSLAFAPGGNSMSHRPKDHTNILEKHDFHFIGSIGIIGSLLTLTAFFLGVRMVSYEAGRSMAFATILFIQPFVLLYLLSRQSLRRGLSFLARPLFSLAFFATFLLHLLVLYYGHFANILHVTPIPLPLLAFSLIISILILLPLEIFRMRQT